MTWRPFSLKFLAATLLLPALSGCAYFQKSTPPPASITTSTPALLPPPLTPLDTELSLNNPPLPDLPDPALPDAQPTPPPASIIVDRKPQRPARRHGRKGEIEVAELHDHEAREAREKEAAPQPPPNPPAEGQTVKVTAPTPKGDTGQTTPIGPLTTAPTSSDGDGSRQQAASLIDSTQRGVGSLHNLNGDQTKTVAQIRSFLDQAQRALHNGDIDGAHTLATKAKTLLDELTGAA
jgi:hypothetical protein